MSVYCTIVNHGRFQNLLSDRICSGVRVTYGDGSIDMPFLRRHGGKQRNGDTHDVELTGVEVMRCSG